MSTTKTSSKNDRRTVQARASHDLGVMRHAVWEAAHEAGLTHNGHPLKIGGVMGSARSKGARDKRACRGRGRGRGRHDEE